MIAEFARVLSPGGVLVLSSPNRPEYSDARHYANPFHLHELDRDELARLLAPAFPAQRWFRQRRYLGSALWNEDAQGDVEHWEAGRDAVGVAQPPSAMYFVVVAARDAAALPSSGPALSLLTDRDDREWHRIDAQAREVLRLDALLKERDGALDRQTHHVRHLEALVAERDARLAGHDRELAARERTWREARDAAEATLRQERVVSADERARLERAIAALERLVAYRQSVRWWLKLPLVRVRLLWKRLRGE